MKYNIEQIKNARAKEIAIIAGKYLSIKPNAESIAMSRVDFTKICEAAQKEVRKASKKAGSKSVRVEVIFIRRMSRDIEFFVVD